MHYDAIVAREGRTLSIEFPQCPGCATFAGSDEDPDMVAREALAGWLEAELAVGRVPPIPRTIRRRDAVVMPVFVPPALAARVQIRHARAAQGLSQAQLAARVGVTRQAISQLESPDANLRLSTLEKVADVLGLEVELTLRKPRTITAPWTSGDATRAASRRRPSPTRPTPP